MLGIHMLIARSLNKSHQSHLPDINPHNILKAVGDLHEVDKQWLLLVAPVVPVVPVAPVAPVAEWYNPLGRVLG